MAPEPGYSWTGKLRKLAEESALRLKESMNAEAVWLFGSAAKDATNADSDIDLLAIVSHSDEPRYRRAQRAHRILSDIRVPKDVIVLTREEWDSQLRVVASLPSTVVREGILLHGT